MTELRGKSYVRWALAGWALYSLGHTIGYGVGYGVGRRVGAIEGGALAMRATVASARAERDTYYGGDPVGKSYRVTS